MSAEVASAAAEAAPSPILLRTAPPSPKRLSRKVLLAGALSAGAIVAFALVSGLSDRPNRPGVAEENVIASGNPPETISQAPASYLAEDLPLGAPEAAEAANIGELQPPADALWGNSTPPERTQNSGAAASQTASPSPSPDEVGRASDILFASEPGRAATRARAAEHRLSSRLTPPGSRYELQSGHVIPAALVTSLNSDRPGAVIAQVTAPVYDSVSGAHLLIPQGARLVGAYEGGTRYGDQRLLLVWRRIILPNGWSPTDGAGASGLSDRTDNHLDRLGVAIGLSAIISVIANEAEDDNEENASLTQSLGDAAAAQAAQSGARIVDRELSVRPTLRIRAGAPVRVLVTRDIALRPYINAAR